MDNITVERESKNPILFITLNDQDAMEADESITRITTHKTKDKGDAGTINDPKLGVVEMGKECPTCHGYLKATKPGEFPCLGHMGKIVFEKPIYHVEMIKVVEFLLNIFNFYDYIDYAKDVKKEREETERRILEAYKKGQKPEKYESKIKPFKVEFRYSVDDVKNKIINIANFRTLNLFMHTIKPLKVSPATYKAKEKNKAYTLEIEEKRKEGTTIIDPDYVYSFLDLLGKKGTPQNDILGYLGFHSSINPKNLMIKVFPVLPNRLRTQGIDKGSKAQNKFNNYYNGILNGKEKAESKNISKEDREKAYEKVYKNIFNLLKSKTDPNSSIKKSMSGKEGIFRKKIFGGSFPKVGRVTITGTTECGPSEVILGAYYADKVTSQYVVTEENLAQANEWISSGRIKTYLSDEKVLKVKKIPILDEDYKLITTATNKVELKTLMSKISSGNILKAGNDIYNFNTGSTQVHKRRIEEPQTMAEVLVEAEAMLKKRGKLDLYSAKNFLYQADIKVGDKLDKPIMEGDVIFANRYPTMGPQSWVALTVAKVDYIDMYIMQIHYSICEGTHADFDGDEMHFQLPATEMTKQEIKDNASWYKTMRSDKDGTIINGFLQLAYTFIQELSEEKYKFTVEEVDKILNQFIDIGKTRNAKDPKDALFNFKYKLNKHKVPYNSCRAVLSTIFPENFKFYRDGKNPVVIEDGILIQGTITKSLWQTGQGSIFQTINSSYSEEVTTNFDDQGYKLMNAVSKMKGFSLNYFDVYLDETKVIYEMKTQIENAFKKQYIFNKTYQKVIDELKKVKYADYDKIKDELHITEGQYVELVNDLEDRFIEKIADKVSKGDLGIKRETIENLKNRDILNIDQVEKEYNITIDEDDIVASITAMYNKDIQRVMPDLLSKIRERGNITSEDIDIFDEEDLKHLQGKIEELSAYSKINKMLETLKEDVKKAKSEAEILSLTTRAKDELETFAKSYLRDNAFAKMALTGAKGSMSDVAKITYAVGQLTGSNGMIPPELKASSSELAGKLEDIGYCSTNMTKGFDIISFVTSIRTTREQILNTYMLTPTIGYALKRMKELTSNVFVDEQAVIKFGKRIIMTKFGDFGLNVNQTTKVRGLQLPIDPEYLLSKYV